MASYLFREVQHLARPTVQSSGHHGQTFSTLGAAATIGLTTNGQVPSAETLSMSKFSAFCVTALLVLGFSPCAGAQQPDETRIEKVESQLRQLRNESATRQQLATEVGNLRNEVNRLRADVRDAAGPGVGLFLFGS